MKLLKCQSVNLQKSRMLIISFYPASTWINKQNYSAGFVSTQIEIGMKIFTPDNLAI
jgi:hypothetical protein